MKMVSGIIPRKDLQTRDDVSVRGDVIKTLRRKEKYKQGMGYLRKNAVESLVFNGRLGEYVMSRGVREHEDGGFSGLVL